MSIIKKDAIDLAELSKQNGKSELENMKAIIELLALKAEFFNLPQTVQLRVKEGKQEDRGLF